MTAVIGGGISGLSACYYLLRRFKQPVTLYEGSNRIGGWIRTEKHKDKGFLFEVGPRTIRPKGVSGANTLELIEDLQLSVDAIPSQHAAARNRLIYAKGQLCPLPNSPAGIFKTLPPFSRPLIRAVFRDIFALRKKAKLDDEPIFDFAERRFGKEIAEYAISPMICGICAGDAKEISVRFLLEDLFEKEQKWGGVAKGFLMSKLFGNRNRNTSGGIFAENSWPNLFQQAQREKWSMYRVQNGLETLPLTLAHHLRDRKVDIQLSAECKSILFTPQGVQMNVKGRDMCVDHIVAALPSYKLAACVKQQHPSLAGQLAAIPYVDVAVVNLQYSSADLLHMKAFGFLVPPVEQVPILGVIFDSCCFDMSGNTVLTVMMGGRWFEQYFGKQPRLKELAAVATKHVNQILGITQDPKLSRVHVLQKCIPQYVVGHKQRVSDIRRYIAYHELPLTLCGAAYDGVGLNDVIYSARTQVEAMPALKDKDA